MSSPRTKLSPEAKAEKVAAMKAKLERVRKHGAKVTIHNKDGTDTIKYLKPKGDGRMQWTDEAGNPIDPHSEPDVA